LTTKAVQADPVQPDRAESGAPAPREAGGDDPRRRCIVTRAVRPKTELLRFVLAPDGGIVPDLAGSLPGRGIWVSSRRPVLEKAIASKAFARAAKTPSARMEADLADRIADMLLRRCLDLIGLARRAGQAVAGFEKVADAMRHGRAALLLEASDGARNGRAKLRSLRRSEGERRAEMRSGDRELPVISLFTGEELGVPFGREFVVHVAVAGRFAERLQAEAFRLAGFRRMDRDSGAG
jgi:uncharacterized protein